MNLTLKHRAEAIVKRHSSYRWYNRPRLTKEERTILQQHMEQKLQALTEKASKV